MAKRNRDIVPVECAPLATDTQFELLRLYLEDRHSDGGMADMSLIDYQSMVQDSPINSQIIEYRVGSKIHNDGPVVGASLTDELDDGLSMVYSFFNPSENDRSLGTFMILDHIRIARQKGLPYLYLGYWIAGCNKMDYKARFSPLEFLRSGKWTTADDHGLIL